MTQRKMSGHEASLLDFSISKIRKSAAKSLFIPSVVADKSEAIAENASASNCSRYVEHYFSLEDVEQGAATVSSHADQVSSQSINDFELG